MVAMRAMKAESPAAAAARHLAIMTGPPSVLMESEKVNSF